MIEQATPEQKRRLFSFAAIFIIIALLLSAISYSGPKTIVDDGPSGDDMLGIPINVRLSDQPQSNNEPHIAINPTDPLNIVAACNDYGTPLEDAWIGIYTSIDGGKNWTRSLLPGFYERGDPKPGEVLWGFKGTGDPVVVFDKDGNCFIAGITFYRVPLVPGRNSEIFVGRSSDKGFTWQVSAVVNSVTAGTFHDKEWIGADPNTGDLYVTWTAFNFQSVASLMWSKSTDGGVSWSRARVLSDLRELELQVQGSYVVVDKNSNVHVTWIDFDMKQVRYSTTSNGGDTWTQPRSIAPVTAMPWTLPDGTYRTPTMATLAVDRSDGPYSGSLYVTWNDYSNENADIFMIYSRDNGDTWSNISMINNDNTGTDQFFPAIDVSPQGWVHVIFYDKRNDSGNNVMLDIYYALSKNGGENFSIQVPLTTTNFDGDNSGGFIGDYIGLVTDGTTAHGVWCDTRDGTESNTRSELYYGAIQFNTGSLNSTGEWDTTTSAS